MEEKNAELFHKSEHESRSILASVFFYDRDLRFEPIFCESNTYSWQIVRSLGNMFDHDWS